LLVTVVNSASSSTLVVAVAVSCGVSVSEAVVTDSARTGTLSVGSSVLGSDFSGSVDAILLGAALPETPLAACA
jgi:hypothetical protein